MDDVIFGLLALAGAGVVAHVRATERVRGSLRQTREARRKAA